MKLSKMKKEDLELLAYTSIAKLYLEENKTPMTTADLFKEICKLLELTERDYQDKITDFFQSLTTSKEFILLDDGKWDLRNKHKIKIDMDDLYEEKEDEENYDVADDNEEEDEYNSIDDEDEYAEEDLGDLTILNEDELEDSE